MLARLVTLFYAVFMAAGVLAADGINSIRGQVNFTGTIPAREPLKIGGDKVCEEINRKNPILREEVVVNPNKTLKNVVVWISSGGPDLPIGDSKKGQKQVLMQQGCTFYPHVLALQVGQPLEMRNADPTIHNINALPEKNSRFNKAMIGKDAKPAVVTFDKPELPVRLRCDIHPWMVAYVAVFDHPLFAVTGDDGTFEISDLPPGEYVVESWHEKFGKARAEVLLQKDKPAEVVFTYTDTGSSSGIQADNAPAAIDNATSATQ